MPSHDSRRERLKNIDEKNVHMKDKLKHDKEIEKLHEQKENKKNK